MLRYTYIQIQFKFKGVYSYNTFTYTKYERQKPVRVYVSHNMYTEISEFTPEATGVSMNRVPTPHPRGATQL